ncbi:MAG: hypothetical protein ACYTA3_07875, partial [Planctomycetota bacterium]
MTKARRIEGPRAPLFYSAAAFLLLSGKMTAAQTVDLSTLEQCAGLETEDLRLACFEAIVAGSKTPDTPEPGAADIPVSGPPVAEVEAACFEAIVAGSKTPDTPEPGAADIPVSGPPVAEVEAVPEAQPPVEVMRQEAPSVEEMPQVAPAVDAAADRTPAAIATSTAVAAMTEPAAAAQSVMPEPS